MCLVGCYYPVDTVEKKTKEKKQGLNRRCQDMLSDGLPLSLAATVVGLLLLRLRPLLKLLCGESPSNPRGDEFEFHRVQRLFRSASLLNRYLHFCAKSKLQGENLASNYSSNFSSWRTKKLEHFLVQSKELLFITTIKKLVLISLFEEHQLRAGNHFEIILCDKIQL